MIWPEGFEHEHRNWPTLMGYTCYSIWFTLILLNYASGHITLGTAHCAGPPHLILISLCSSILLCAVWWFRVWFCQTCHLAQIETEGRATLKKNVGISKTQQLKLEPWYTFQVGSMVQRGQYIQCSCFPCSLLTLCVGESGQAQVFPTEKRIWMPVTWRMLGVQIHYLSIIYIPLSLCDCRSASLCMVLIFFSVYEYIVNNQ